MISMAVPAITNAVLGAEVGKRNWIRKADRYRRGVASAIPGSRQSLGEAKRWCLRTRLAILELANRRDGSSAAGTPALRIREVWM